MEICYKRITIIFLFFLDSFNSSLYSFSFLNSALLTAKTTTHIILGREPGVHFIFPQNRFYIKIFTHSKTRKNLKIILLRSIIIYCYDIYYKSCWQNNFVYIRYCCFATSNVKFSKNNRHRRFFSYNITILHDVFMIFIFLGKFYATKRPTPLFLWFDCLWLYFLNILSPS